jgi:cytochrome d ubiquinol oxidase subunit II
LPLWTDWRVGPQPGILDWYTIIGGVLALIALAPHGALYLAVKTENELQQRARRLAKRLSIAVLVLTFVSLPASMSARPDALQNYRSYPILFMIPVLLLLALLGTIYFGRREDDRPAFVCSSLYLSLMLVGAAVALYPRLLPSSDNSGRDITVAKALSGPHTLRVGLVWWAAGMCFASVYFIVVYRMFRGKVRLEEGGYGH